MEILVIDHAELTGGHALHPAVGMHPIASIAKILSRTNEIAL